MKKYILPILFAGSALLTSCSDDFLNPDQNDSFSDDRMEKLAKFPESALLLAEGIEAGAYSTMVAYNNGGAGQHDDFGQKAYDIAMDLMGNDMTMSVSHFFVNYYNYTARAESNSRNKWLWEFYNRVASNMNELLLSTEGAKGSDDIIENIEAVRGRALAIRAHANFMLVRLYADGENGIPYATEHDFNFGRMPTSQVNDFIEKDLLAAYDLLEGYQRTSLRSLDSKVVAGLLSRFYLYKENYAEVIKYSDLALGGATMTDFNVVNDGFSNISNPDWMWGFDIDGSSSTVFASFFSHMDNTNDGYAGIGIYKNIDVRLYDMISATDKRQSWFSDGSEDEETNPYGLPKYANTKFIDKSFFFGDYLYMRKTEMFLNKAEAAAALNDDATAIAILNDLMSSRDAAYAFSGSGDALKEEVRKQRRIELWGEGFGLLDMKRWKVGLERIYEGSNHPTMGAFSFPYPTPKFIFQFPLSEVNANPDLGVQNPF